MQQVKYKEYKKSFSYRDFLEWDLLKKKVDDISSNWESYDYIKSSMENGDLSQYVKEGINIFSEAFSGVFFKNTSKIEESKQQEIVLLDSFYAFMWSYSYFMLVLHDYILEYHRVLSGQNPTANAPTNDMLIGAVLVKQHADNQIVRGTTRNSWMFYPQSTALLPNPFNYEENREFYISKANGVYCYAVAFILGHEYHHFYYGDLYAQFDDEESQKNELFADATSLEKYASLENLQEKETFAAGIATALMTLYFLEKRDDFPKENVDNGHPSVIIRLQKDIEKLKLLPSDPLYDYLGVIFESYASGSIKNTSVQYGSAYEYYKKMLTLME